MTKRKPGPYADFDDMDNDMDAVAARLKDMHAKQRRARADANFAEMAEADFRGVLDRVLIVTGSVLERQQRDGVLDLRTLETALAEANQRFERFAARSDAHYAERQAELERQQEALRAAETAFMEEPPEETPLICSGTGEAPAQPPAIAGDDLGIGTAVDDDDVPAFLRRKAA